MLAVNGESVTVRKGDRVGIYGQLLQSEKNSPVIIGSRKSFWNCLEDIPLFIRRHSFSVSFFVNAEKQNAGDETETSAHETMEVTLRQSMEGRKGEKAKSYLTKHAVTEEKEPSDFSLHVKNAPIQEVLRSLAELTGKNIVFGGTVTGSVTADLDHVTPKGSAPCHAGFPGAHSAGRSEHAYRRW